MNDAMSDVDIAPNPTGQYPVLVDNGMSLLPRHKENLS